MTEAVRCFVAVPIGDALRTELAHAVQGWKARPDLEGLRWTDPAGWHVTLAFLGSVDVDAVDRIGETVARVAAAGQAVELETGGVGGFPSTRHARVAWYGVTDPDRALAELAARLRGVLGLDTAAHFRAHLTLGRARGVPVDLSAWRENGGAPSGILDVASLELMRSHRGRGPARYETIRTASLGAPAHV